MRTYGSQAFSLTLRQQGEGPPFSHISIPQGGSLEGPLTDSLIETLSVSGGFTDIYDTTCPGLYVRLTVREKSFMVRYREEGDQIHYMVGRFPEISVAEARLRASEILSRQQEISDPPARPLPPSPKKDSLTLGEALETYVEAKKTLLRPRTIKDIRYTITRYCAGYLDHPLATFDERTAIGISNGIVQVRDDGRERFRGETVRNTTIRILRAIFNYMKDIKLYSGENPFSNPRRKALHSRDRVRELPPAYYMNPSVVGDWGREAFRLNQDPDVNPRVRDAAGFALFLLLTGMRQGDGKRLTPGHLSFVNANDLVISLKETKNRRDYILPVPPLFRKTLQQVVHMSQPGPESARTLFRIRDIRGVSLRILERLAAKYPELSGQRPLSPHDLRKLYTSAAIQVCGDANLANYLTCHVAVGVIARNYMFIPVSAWNKYSERIQEHIFDSGEDAAGKFDGTAIIHGLFPATRPLDLPGKAKKKEEGSLAANEGSPDYLAFGQKGPGEVLLAIPLDIEGSPY